MLAIASMSNESGTGRGTVGSSGGKGLSEPSPCMSSMRLLVRFPQTVPNRLAFGASVGLCEHAIKREKGYDCNVSAASPMLKLAKRMEKIRKPISVHRIAYLFSVGVFHIYLNFSLIFGKIILSCWVYNLSFLIRDQFFIIFKGIISPIKFDFPYQRPIPLFRFIVLRRSELRDPWMNIL